MDHQASGSRADEVVQRSLRRFELLARTAEELLHAPEPQKVVESLCRQVMEHLDCHAFFNFLVDEAAGRLRLNACAGIPDEEARRIEWLDYGAAVCGCAARDGCRIVAEHIPDRPDPRTDLVKSYGIRAYACHPLLGPGGRILGTLSFGTRGRETFCEDDLSLMKAVTDQVATAMVRMQGEQALRAGREQLRLITDAVPALISYIDDEYRYGLVNQTYQRWFGRTPEQIRGRHVREVLGEAAWQKVQPYMARALAGEQVSYEQELPYAGGGPRWVHVTYTPDRDQAGQVHGFVVLVQDIGQRKRAEEQLAGSEERYRTLFTNMIEGFALGEALLDGQGRGCDFRFLEVNDAFERQTGLPRGILGRPMTQVLPRLERHWVDTYCRVALAGEPVTFVNYNADTSRYYDVFCYCPVKGRFAILFRDVTSQKKAEQQLKELNETLERRVAERTAEAEQRAAQLRALAADLAQAEQRERKRIAQILHDHFQQLLVGAKFDLSIVHSRLPGPEAGQDLERVSRTLDEAIEASRSLAVELSPPVLHDAGLAAGLAWLGRWMHERHGLPVDVHAAAGIEPADEDVRIVLFHAVQELLFNVVKHARAQRAVIEVCQADHRLEIVVRDDGTGFDLSAHRAREQVLSGFGLFSIRERLEMLGGGLEVQSEPGRGTRVVLHVPITPRGPEPQPSAAGPVAEAAPAVVTPATWGGTAPIRVLLADDHQVVRDGLSRLLQMQPGIAVVGQASDGREAVERALQVDPDVVIMDISMPRLNGIEATRRILAQRPRVRVIGLSMHGDGEMARTMREAGAANYLPKSSSPEVLIEAIYAVAGVAGRSSP